MKKVSKLLLVAVLALGMGLTACNNEEVPDQEQSLGGNTWASISIAFPKSGTNTRAALPEDYNKNGVWEGRDKINRVDVYLVNANSGTIDKTSFNTERFDVDADGVLQPNLAIKATAGQQIKAYVVVNDTAGSGKVRPVLDAATALNFANVFKGAVDALAANVATANATEDVILMTNAVAPVAVSLEPGVTEAQAKNPSEDKNLIKVNVERVVSRAIATQSSTLASTTIGVKAAGGTGAVASTLEIKKIEYAVGQSNKKFNILKDAANWTTPDPVYSFVPSTTSLWNTGRAYFDYTGLTSYAPLQAIATSSNADVITALNAEHAASKFVLPVTHADADYRKGNTTYFEIRVVFTPTEVDGVPYTYDTGHKLFLGSITGRFYSTRALAQAAGETVITQYKNDGAQGFITKYITWLNPDAIPGVDESPNVLASKSPTVRNQVYHVHVTGFKGIGVPNNPLNPGPGPSYPGDPDDPKDPDNPKNPIDPNDPLENEETYMSVQITVLDYTVHSYDIELGIDY